MQLFTIRSFLPSESKYLPRKKFFFQFEYSVTDSCTGYILKQDLMERLKTPSDAQLMQIAIDDLNNSTLSLEDHLHALQELLILVEPIDNANGRYNFFSLSLALKSASLTSSLIVLYAN